jgi:hypothetical protein
MRSSHPRSPIDHQSNGSKSQILVNSKTSIISLLHSILESKSLFTEFLERLTDRVVSMLQQFDNPANPKVRERERESRYVGQFIYAHCSEHTCMMFVFFHFGTGTL